MPNLYTKRTSFSTYVPRHVHFFFYILLVSWAITSIKTCLDLPNGRFLFIWLITIASFITFPYAARYNSSTFLLFSFSCNYALYYSYIEPYNVYEHWTVASQAISKSVHRRRSVSIISKRHLPSTRLFVSLSNGSIGLRYCEFRRYRQPRISGAHVVITAETVRLLFWIYCTEKKPWVAR